MHISRDWRLLITLLSGEQSAGHGAPNTSSIKKNLRTIHINIQTRLNTVGHVV